MVYIWKRYISKDLTIMHQYPINDLIEHTTIGKECVCGPDSETIAGKVNGKVAWVITHYSLGKDED